MVTYFLHRYVLLFLFGHLIFSLWKLIELLANHRTACLTLLIYYFVYTRNSINFFKNSQISPSIKDIWFMFLKNSFRCVLFMYHLFSLLFDFVVFRMCTIYSTIYGWKTPFAYYFYFFFLVKCFDVHEVTCFYYISDLWQYFYSNHVLLSLR